MNFTEFHTYLLESFSTAKQKFSQEASPPEVDSTISKFRQLTQKGAIKSPEEKDITKWIPQGFEKFKQFVSSFDNYTSGKEKKQSIGNDAIKVMDDANWTVIIPLTVAASQKYGANTKWCTAGSDMNNLFNNYFHAHNTTLFYIISKTSNEKYAVAIDNDNGIVHSFDAEDDKILFYQLKEITGISLDQFHEWEEENENKLIDTRENNTKNDPEVIFTKLYNDFRLPDERESKILLKNMSVTTRFIKECARHKTDWPEFDNYIITRKTPDELDIVTTSNFQYYMYYSNSDNTKKMVSHIFSVFKDTNTIKYLQNNLAQFI